MTSEIASNIIDIVQKKKILIVDVENKNCDSLSQGLANEFNVTVVDDVEIAFRLASKSPPDIALIDEHIGADSGIDLCYRFRNNQLLKNIPILILADQGTQEKMLLSYDMGADDYIEKPIDLTIIRNRLKARIQRAQAGLRSEIAFGNIKLFHDTFEVELDGSLHKLSEIEFDLLRIFLTHPNKNITRDEILKTIWVDTRVEDRTVDVHISSLRRKLKTFNYKIKALYGSGYILRPTIKHNLE